MNHVILEMLSMLYWNDWYLEMEITKADDKGDYCHIFVISYNVSWNQCFFIHSSYMLTCLSCLYSLNNRKRSTIITCTRSHTQGGVSITWVHIPLTYINFLENCSRFHHNRYIPNPNPHTDLDLNQIFTVQYNNNILILPIIYIMGTCICFPKVRPVTTIWVNTYMSPQHA